MHPDLAARALGDRRRLAAVVGVGVGDDDAGARPRCRRPACSSARSRLRHRAAARACRCRRARCRRPPRAPRRCSAGRPGRAAAGAAARRRAARARRGRTSRGRVGLRIAAARYRPGDGEEGPPPRAHPGAGERVPRRARHVLVLRGALTPATRLQYADGRGRQLLSREDAWQRAVEFLFERLAVRWEIAGTEPITRQKELLGALPLRLRRTSGAGSATRCASTSPSTSRSCRRRDRPRRLRPPAARLLPRRAARPAGRGALHDARRAAAARAPARDPRARGVAAAARRRCPARTRPSGRPRATRTSTASRPPSSPRPSGSTPRCASRRPRTPTRSPASTRRGWPAPPARARRCARPRVPAALVRHAVADAGRRPAGRHGHAPSSPPSCSRALFLDRDDPVAAWGELRAFQARLIERLAPASARSASRPTGTDLTLARRAAAPGSTPTAGATCPSGEVFTGPHEDSAEGTHPLHDPDLARAASRSTDVELEFREGRVVGARAERGDAYLQATLDTDAGARCLGELGIGTNFGIDRPIGAILFDEKIGGTVHLALGRSYPETGGTNESRRALGPDLRPARRRAAERRRRAGGAGKRADVSPRPWDGSRRGAGLA